MKQKFGNYRRLLGLLSIVLVLAMGLVLSARTADAANPTTINFQGKVVNSDGTNVADGSHSFVFRIYDNSSPTIGANCNTNNECWWEETDSLTTTSGVFQVELGSGSGCAFTSACNSNHSGIDWNSNSSLYLTMKYAGDSSGTHNGFMWPVVHLTSVPYAFNADKLGGIAASGFVQLQASSPGTQQTGSLNISGTGIFGTAVQTPLLQTASSVDLQIKPSTGLIKVNTASVANEIRIFENNASPTNYTSITYGNISTNSGNLTVAAAGTTTIGNGTGAVTINAGSGSAVNITGHAASTWQTDSGGSLTIQGGSTLTLQSTTSSNITLDSGTTGAVQIGTGANNKAITVGSTTSGTTVSVVGGTTANTAVSISTSGAGGITIDSGTTGNINIGTGANSKAIAIGNSQASTTVTTTTTGVTTTSNSNLVIKTTTNSSTGMQVQNAAGAAVLNIDTTDSQLITTNPGFEANPLTGWSALAGGTVARDTTQNYIGFASGKVTAGTSSGGGISNTSAGSLTNGTQYTLSFYAKLDSASAALTTMQAGYSANGTTGGETDCTWQGGTTTSATVTTAGWQRYVCSFTAGAPSGTPYIFIQHNDTTSEVFYVDAVQLEARSYPSAYGAGAISINATVNSPAIFTNSSDSTTAFQIQKNNNLTLFTVDTASGNQNNLVTNPSAEVGLAASGTWSARGSSTVTQSADFAYNGYNSVKVVTTAAANDGVKYTTGASFLTNGSTYTLMGYVKTSSTLTVNTFEVGHADNGTVPTDVSCLTGQVLNSGWTKFTCTWTSGAITGTPYIYFKQTDAVARTFYVDAVLLQTDANADSNYRDGKINFGNALFNNPVIFQNAQNSSTAFQIQNAAGAQVFTIDTTDTNLISNPGFETNTTGWTASGTGSIRRESSQTYLGLASLKVVSQAAANSGAQFALNPVVTKASTTYTISWYARLDGASAAFTDMIARYSPDGAATSDCSVTAMNSQTVVTGGWTRYFCAVSSATAPSSSGFIRIMQTGATAHTYYIDAVQMEETTVANMTAYGAGTFSLNGVVTSPLIFKNLQNSVSAVQIQNSSGLNLLTTDTLNSVVQIGSSTTDANAFFLVLDSYSTSADPTAPANGAMYYNTGTNVFRCRENGIWKNCIDPPSNASTADQTVNAATTAYLTGSAITIPQGGVRAGTQFIWRLGVTKTGAGTAASTFDVKFGTNGGTTSDTSRLVGFSTGTETANADTAQITIIVTVRSVSGTGTITGNFQLVHNSATLGFATINAIDSTITSGTFDDTVANSTIGLSVTTGALDVFTFQQVQAQAVNL